MLEFDLYEPMRAWLDRYLRDKYPHKEIIVVDAHSERLDKVLKKYDVDCDVAIGVDIQIDVLGIAKNFKHPTEFQLTFIEAKKTMLTLRDLGQLWSYCKLIDPEEAFLLSPAGLGILNRLLNVYGRQDLLDYGNGNRIKKMVVGEWSTSTNAPVASSLIPKL